MSAYQTTQALQGLRTILARIRDDAARFHDHPVSAVGMFLEGYGLSDPLHLDAHHTAAQFLGVPVSHLRQVAGFTFAHRDTTHAGPYLVYLATGEGRELPDAEGRIAAQLEALDRYLPHLHRLTRQLPPPALDLLPAEPDNWWASLFHLAIHRPRPLFEATRERWVNVTGPAPHAVGIWRQTFPRPSRVHETTFQLHGFTPPCEDFVPGMIWSRLAGDVFTASAMAVEVLIERLEQPTPPPADMAAIRRRFAELHAEFSAVAEAERRLLRPAAARPDSPAHVMGGAELRLVKVASSFRMPPAAEWCGLSMELAFDHTLLLSRHHADAEYLLTRRQFTNFNELAEQAGAALPPTALDTPVLFTRSMGEGGLPPGVVAGTRVRCSALNPHPAARWVRFVFNSLRANDHGGRSVEVRFLDPPPGTRNPFPDLYGHAALPDGFFAASARAIELAGLLPPSPPPAPPADLLPPALVAYFEHLATTANLPQSTREDVLGERARQAVDRQNAVLAELGGVMSSAEGTELSERLNRLCTLAIACPASNLRPDGQDHHTAYAVCGREIQRFRGFVAPLAVRLRNNLANPRTATDPPPARTGENPSVAARATDPPAGALIPRCDRRLLCSSDCGVVQRGEETFLLTGGARAVIEHMVAGWDTGRRVFSQGELHDWSGSVGKRFRDVFRSDGKTIPAWGRLIVPVKGQKRFYTIEVESQPSQNDESSS